ncbi:MAG: leucine-rich repeat protein [Clostridia bacterium]|nr:leucine-rich repeat protein [Clostridia bacterium]
MAKLSEKSKVLLLEETVLKNDTAAVKALFEQHKTFEFTARALGLASRYCGAEMVKALIKNGASFCYTATPAFKTKYDCSVAISNSYSFSINYINYLLPAYKIKNEPRPIISDEERIAVLRVWHEQNACNFEELLYLAILHQDDAVYTELQALGITKISQYRKNIISGELPYSRLDAYDRYDRGEFQRKIANSSDIPMKTMLERFLAAMEIETLLLAPSDFHDYDFDENRDKLISRYCSPVLFDFFLKKTNMLARVKKSEMLYALIERDNAEGLGYALAEKWVEKDKDINQLLQYARGKENPSPAVLAVLMDKQNKDDSVFDVDKAFSLTPSAADLKKIWSTKKQESDGTLIITSYKGTDTDVVIPDKIGKTAVTAIDSQAFDPMAPRLTEIQRKARKELFSVVFPETITKIPERLFAGLSELKIITLGEKTEKIGKQAFSYTGLEEIILPNSIRKIDDCAFRGCSNLKTIKLPKNLTSLSYGIFENTGFETFEVPEHIENIGSRAFNECKKLKTLILPKHIQKIPANMVSNCPCFQNFTFSEAVSEIGAYAFYNTAIKECIIPENISSIGAGAFECCKVLSKLDLPAHTITENRAFSGCDLLANDDGAIILNGTFFGFAGEYSFVTNASSLKTLVLDDNIKHIARPRDDLPPIVYKAHSEEGQVLDAASLSVGMTVSFGRFPQFNDFVMKPLVWRVLAVENDLVLLMTENEIMSLYDGIHQCDDWENSNVRKLLNESFFQSAFTEKEQAQIETVSLKNLKNPSYPGTTRPNTKDKVFLLSFEEAEKYLPTEESRKTTPTEYAHAQTRAKRDWGFWNLRTEGKDHWGAVAVSEDSGGYAMSGNHVGHDYIRPCIWVKNKGDSDVYTS